ncbi:MAG TPA: hypothetical protein VM120_27910 [Bryobacteraceae bacterium]|nr:hypothetical protein [Bryobacteraceae bacterium]
MSFGKVSMAAIVALSMTSAPALAQTATPASKLSVASSQARVGAAVEDESQLGGGFIIPLLALAAIIAGILVVLDDNDEPTSP